MIPLTDRNPSRSFPFVNLFLILINFVLFCYQYLVLPHELSERFLQSLSCIPYEMIQMVDIYPPNLVPAPFTLITYLFVHAGIVHLLANMLFLWVFGDNVEDKLGHLKYLFFYLVCGVAGAIVHIFLNPGSKIPCVGASGAISGIMAAYVVFFPRARIKTLLFFFIFVHVTDIPAFVFIGYWFLVQLFSGIFEAGQKLGRVAWFVHIGGFLAGLLLAISIKKS